MSALGERQKPATHAHRPGQADGWAPLSTLAPACPMGLLTKSVWKRPHLTKLAQRQTRVPQDVRDLDGAV